MRILSVWALFTLRLVAGVIQGVVVEQATGLPLSRTLVRLDAVPNPGVEFKPAIVRTGRGGGFVFPSVPPGQYLLKSTRPGYFAAAHGQRRPNGAATPIEVTKDSNFFSTLSMRRLGAITGRVLDENGVGLPSMAVVAYRARPPLVIAGRAISDDRGVYRITGLLPGKYWVRSVAQTLDDGSGVLPTFAPELMELRDARVFRVELDVETPYADVRPIAGNLTSVAGTVVCPPDRTPPPVAIVTLSSDTGRRTTESGCNGGFSFQAVAPGNYMVTAVLRDYPESGYMEVRVDGRAQVSIPVLPNPQVSFEVRRAGSSEPPPIPVSLFGRRRDLSETEPDFEIPLPRATLAAGVWEMGATVGAGYYLESIASGMFAARRYAPAAPSNDRFDVNIETRGSARVRITVSDRPGNIEGHVAEGQKNIAGVPVFLWPQDEAARRSLRGAPQTITDIGGRFRFENLPPGDYRLLATFDISEVDEETLEAARAPSHKVSAGQRVPVELSVWVAP